MAGMAFNINISQSKILLIYLVLLHSLMMITMCSVLDFDGWALMIMTIILLSFIYYARQHQWLKSKKILIKIKRNTKGKWDLIYSDGSQQSKLILASSYVTSLLAILYFKKKYFWQRRAVTIVVDAVDAELFRQLRVYCRDPKTFQR